MRDGYDKRDSGICDLRSGSREIIISNEPRYLGVK